MECVACEGRDPACGECGGSGETTVTRCPCDESAGVAGIVELSDFLDTCRVFPMGGGVLDQTEGFLDAHRYYRAQVVHWTAEKVKNPRG